MNLKMSQSEKQQILEMHKSAVLRNYLNEQGNQPKKGGVKPLISEQTKDNNWYFAKAKELLDAMSWGDGSEKVIEVINQINTEKEWSELQRAYGKPDGDDLSKWIKEELDDDTFNKIFKDMWSRIGKQKDTDLFKVGSRIRLVTNREFIQGRENIYSNTMGDTRETEFEINGAVIVASDSNSITIKTPSTSFVYDVDNYKTNSGNIPKVKPLNSVCIKIPLKDMHRYDDTIQVKWFATNYKSYIVKCP